jgi:hypothetical protein
VSNHSAPSGKRRRFTPLALLAGLAGVVALSLSLSSTVSAFTATITNSVNSATTGSLVMQETGPNAAGVAQTCNSNDGSLASNTFTCATINKYGGGTTLVPSNAAGTTNTITTTVNFKNTGTVPASSFTLGFLACNQTTGGAGAATDLCSKLMVSVKSGSTTVIANATAASLATTTTTIPAALVPAVNSGTTVPFTFTVYLASTADSSYQALTATQQIVWTFTS